MSATTKHIATHIRRIGFLLVLCSFLLPAFAEQKNADPKEDAVLSAMRAELERSKSQLKMEQVGAPYYIEYRVFDLDQYSVDTIFGASRGDVRTRLRFLRVVVRIGDYKQDSYFGQGQGTLDYMPLDDDMLSLRHQLWLATDRAYKSAAESFTAKQAQLKQLTIDQPVDDFAHADPVQSIGPLVRLDFDPAPWKKTLEDASALYKNDPDIESFESNLKFNAVNRYFINSEGSVVRSGQNILRNDRRCDHTSCRWNGFDARHRVQRRHHEGTPVGRRFYGASDKAGRNLEGIARGARCGRRIPRPGAFRSARGYHRVLESGGREYPRHQA